jgi:hypothetical protein
LRITDGRTAEEWIGVALGRQDSKATERYRHVAASVASGLAEARWERLAKATPTHTPTRE